MFSCPHCFRRLARLDLVPWFELLHCEWSGRAYLKVHDLKWDFALAALAPDAARALVHADAAERGAALALVRTVGESRVDVERIEEHLRARVAAGAIERVEATEFAYFEHPHAVAWIVVPALAAALLAVGLAMAPILSPFVALPTALAALALVLRPLIGRLRRRPFRLTIAGGSLELALAGRLESWPLADVACRLTPPQVVARVYVRGGPALLRHGDARAVVHPDLPRFDELVRRLRAGGAVIQEE